MSDSKSYIICPKCQIRLIWEGRYEQIRCSKCGALINVVPNNNIAPTTILHPNIKGLNLLPNEAVILKETRVVRGNVIWHWDAHEVTLTNLNIIVAVGAAMGRPSALIKYPIQMIKTYEGKPQILITNNRDNTLVMEIYFTNGETEIFEFQDEKREERYNHFIQEVNKLLGAAKKDSSTPTSSARNEHFYNPNCPNCGGRMKHDQYGFKAVCAYCGTEVVLS